MQGASRDALVRVREQLSSLRDSGDLVAAGEGLLAVVRLLDRETSLRRTLADPTTSANAKNGLLDALLGSQLDGTALQLVKGAAAQRWSRARDLSDAVEELGITALLLVAERDGSLDTVEGELFRVERTIAGSPELRAVLTDRGLDGDRKAALLDGLLEGKATGTTRRIVAQAVLDPRGRTLEDALEGFADLAAAVRSRTLATVTSAGDAAAPTTKPYIVVSIEDHRLWYKLRDSVLFTTQVATGSGKVLETGSAGAQWKFETPRGRLVVQAKDQDPAWIPPDWHFVEQARKRGLGIVRLNRGQSVPAGDGSEITVSGADVVRRYPDGRETPVGEGKEGREIVAGGNLLIPPFGTNQRKFKGVLGTHRLVLGDGYALHGTDKPESIGRSVSHGCVRLRNEDIAKLYDMVEVGTPVYIY